MGDNRFALWNKGSIGNKQQQPQQAKPSKKGTGNKQSGNTQTRNYQLVPTNDTASDHDRLRTDSDDSIKLDSPTANNTRANASTTIATILATPNRMSRSNSYTYRQSQQHTNSPVKEEKTAILGGNTGKATPSPPPPPEPQSPAQSSSSPKSEASGEEACGKCLQFFKSPVIIVSLLVVLIIAVVAIYHANSDHKVHHHHASDKSQLASSLRRLR
jgi:hypothetical protein